MKFHVPDMSCGHCKATIERAVGAADPRATITTDLDSRTVTIVSSLDPALVQSTMKDAGYPATPV